MEAFQDIFDYLPTHRIAICKRHHQGIIKSQLRTHLDTKHQDLYPRIRQDIIKSTDTDASLQNWASDADQVVFPRPDTAPLPHLLVYEDGLKCVECGYIYRHMKKMQEHGRIHHSWTQSHTRRVGRPATQQRWTGRVMCQKFHNTSTLGRLFEVQGAAPAELENSDDEEKQLRRVFAKTAAQIDSVIESRNASNVIEEDSSRWGYQTWLNRAGWKRHLKGLDRLWLLDMAQIPSYRERALRDVCWAAEMVIWRAQQASHSSVVGMPAMMHINRREYGTTTNEKPFNASQTELTMKKYRLVWLQVIAYIWRTYELPVVQPDLRDEVQGRRPPYRLTSEQKACLEEMKEIIGYDLEEEAAVVEAEEEAGLESDSDSEEERLDGEEAQALQDQVLAFMLALLDHMLASSEYESGLISGMAVLGVSADRAWLDPLTYTPKQSAMVSISRMLVLYQAHRERSAQVDKLVAGGYSEETASTIAGTHFELVQDMCHRFMALTDYNGRPTPMDAILRLRAFGFKIRYTTNAEGVVDWVGDTLLYGQIQFSMAQLRIMVHGMIASTRQDMLKQLLLLQLDAEGEVMPGTTPCPAIYWDKLVDNAAAQQVGWSFMEDPRNHQATSVGDPKRWLIERIQQEKTLRHAFADAAASRVAMAEGGRLVWVKARIQAYGRAVREARHALAVLVHMTGGAPPRGSELLTIRFQNNAQGNRRGIFIEDGALVFVTTYHKNIAQSGHSKIIHRYVPREVGELVLFYLWFARPFWQRLVVAAWGEVEEESGYMWEPQPEQRWQEPTRKRRRSINPQESTRRVGKASRVRTMPWRDSREESEEGGEEEAEGNEAEREEAEEGRIRTDRPPAVEQWNTNRLKLEMQKASLQYMSVRLNVIGWRHASKAIWRRYIHNPKARKAYMTADEDDASEEEDEAFDLQTGHSSSVAGAIYGRSLHEAIFSVESKRFAFRVASREWHMFLELPSAKGKKLQQGRLAVKARREAVEEEYRRWKMMRLVDIDSELQRLLGPSATFRSVQRPAMQAIMRYESPVVVIMGTGAGKSVLFMLPASVSSGVTVVVVPLVALRFDMKARCDELGIVSGEWDSRRPYRSVQIMFVTPEAAVGEAFGHYINRERSMGRLDRIVIDECHSVLDSLKGFRSRLLGLRQLLRVETQIVYLTATLRPKEEKQFLDVMGLPEKSKCQWFRGRTTRKNIGYRVHEYNIEEEEKAVVELVEKLKERYPLPGQVIVYCGTIARTKRIGKVLGAACYYRAVGTVEEKKKIVRELTSGQRQVFTATNALGLGVDAPTIRGVVHVGGVQQMRQYAQESGRAGRDGGKSEAIIMRGYRMRGRRKEFVGAFGEVEEDMQLFVEGKGCMRAVLDWAMDGVERGMCEEDEVACQRCGWESSDEEEEEEEEEGVGEEGVDKDEEEEKEMGLRLTFEQQERQRQWVGMAEAEQQCRDAMEVEELVGVMEKWGSGCQWCVASGRDGRGHAWEDCEDCEGQEGLKGLKMLQDNWQIVPYSCCYGCWLPQAVCESFAFDMQDGGYRKQREVGCQYNGVLGKVFIIGLMKAGLAVHEVMEQAIELDGGLGFRIDEEVGGVLKGWARWGSEKKRWGGIEGNKLSWVIRQVDECIKMEE